MPEFITRTRRARASHRPYRRWSVSDKAWYLDAFRRSGLSAVAFCREMAVPLATFTLWKRDARRAVQASRHDLARAPRGGVAFARVEVVPATASARVPADAVSVGMRVIVRGAAGDEAALAGVDGPTAVRLVALVLGRRRRRR